MMPDGLYDRDILVWSERQAILLRRLAAGERLNEQVDWANVIEEVEDVGRSELHSCESLLLQALVHLLKMHDQPNSRNVPHWRDETTVFLATARRRFAPSMRQRIDVAGLYADARKARRSAPVECPFDLDMLLDPANELSALLALLQSIA